MNAARKLSEEDLRAVAALKATSRAESAEDKAKAAKTAAVDSDNHGGAASH